MRVFALFVVGLAILAAPRVASAQSVQGSGLPAVAQSETGQVLNLPTEICGLPVGEPKDQTGKAVLPPAGSQPVFFLMMACWPKQGNAPVVEPNTYTYYTELKNRISRPSQNQWVPYTEAIEQVAMEDFKRLWATGFLDDLIVHVQDVRFSNGVLGKVVVFEMEERQRLRIIDYVGSDKVDQTAIDDELKKKGITIRIDQFVDPGTIRRVAGVVRQVYAEKGYQYAEVKPEIKEVAGGPKLVHLTFNITEGPKVRIRKVDFVGNKAVGDRKLRKKFKENKAKGMLSFIFGGGTFKEEKFEEDADAVEAYYREKGHIEARVGQPDLRVLEDTKDKKTRWVELRVPVTEGPRYKVGDFKFDGNTIVRAELLRPLFKLKAGDWYNESRIRKGMEKARELYGTAGYYEFTGYPDLSPRNANAAAQTNAGPPSPSGQAASTASAPGPAAQASASNGNGSGVVDVTMRLQEGKQYFVNRITFLGNTTTRDPVIRREMRLVESGVFNTEALKYSIRRLNQLGYFKPLEGEAIQVDKTPGVDSKVDVKLKFEEQNRNQLTFGAGVSQFEGFFGQLSFQTSNFLGRGETFTVSLQQGSRAKNYQVAFSEPFLFDRPMTAGIDVYNREIEYIGLYTQGSIGGNVVYGFQVADYARMFLGYSYERVEVKDLNTAILNPAVLEGNPFLRDSLLIGLGNKRTVSKVTPSYVYNTVDHPIFPTEGKRHTLSLDVAGWGGNTKFINPRAESIWYFKHTNRTSFGFRAQAEYIRPYGSTTVLPIFEQLYLGGEYSIRGFDLRSVGPRDPFSGIVLGGNKSLLFNAEYLINIAGPVRLVLFADTGQVRDRGENFAWKESVFRTIPPEPPLLTDPLAFVGLEDPNNPTPASEVRKVGELSAFKSSIGAEIRFFMPVLNVPFRLIFAMNPSRGGVFDNNLQAEKKWKFRFAVGSTF